MIHQWDEEIGRDEYYGAAKSRRRHAQDGKRMLVHLNNAAHYAVIVVKMAVPICVAENKVRSAIRATIIGVVKESAKIRLNP